MTVAFLVLLAGAASQDPARAFLEVSAERDAYFVHEPFELSFVFGVEESFAETSMIQLFRRPLDVPVQIEAPWIDGFPGAVALAVEREQGELPIASFARNDDVALAERIEDRAIDGRTFTVLAFERTFLSTDPGELAIPPALLRFAYATRFEDDFVHGRTPVDRRDALVGSAPLTLSILPLPEAGRPSEFTGAVGRLTVRAEVVGELAEPVANERGALGARELVAGESFELALIVEGEGNLALFGAPPLDRLEGFHLLGVLEEQEPHRRRIVYHLVPESAEVAQVPPIRFAYFDTTPPASYRVAETEPIAIRVRPPRASTGPTRPPDSGGDRTATARAHESSDSATNERVAWFLGSGAAALAALCGALLWLRRRQRVR